MATKKPEKGKWIPPWVKNAKDAKNGKPAAKGKKTPVKSKPKK